MLLLWLGILAAAAAAAPSPSSSPDGSSRTTAQYKQAISHGEAALAELLKTHPDIIVDNPNKEDDDELVISTNQYIFDSPPTNDYVVGMLVNPCGTNGTYGREDDVALGYDCCLERFGEGEYGYSLGTHNRFSNGFANGVDEDHPDDSDEY